MPTIYAPRGASLLAAFAPGLDVRPAMDDLLALGFNLLRVFCGPLPWCGQELGHVYDGLPAYCEEAAARGMNVYLSYCTEAGTGYDLDAHVREIEAIACEYANVVLREVANEPTHPTQDGRLPPERCADLAEGFAGAHGYGSGTDDEATDYAGGTFVPVHLDRGRDKWNMVRRVRELLMVSETTGKPAFNQEPIGADETSDPGKRESDPAIFYTMGALNRLFLGGAGVFHSTDGLNGHVLRPNQRTCAQAFQNGANVWPGAHRLQYYNVGHSGSPIVSATFNDGDLSKPGCTRSYCGVDGASGINVTLGIADMNHPGIEWGNGWRSGGEIGRMPGVIVYRLAC